MDNQLKLQKSAEQGLIDFLGFLLENDKVSAVFTLRKTGKESVFDYGLITDPQMLKDTIPLHPYMPANVGQQLSRFTPMKKPIAVVIKPCELRGFIELVKRSQGTLDHFLLISTTCGGAFRFETTVKGQGDEHLPDYWEAVTQGENFEAIRPTCKACEYFVPMNGDVTVSLVGENLDNECVFVLHTEKARKMAEGFEGEESEGELGSSVIDALREKRQAEKAKLFEEIGMIEKELLRKGALRLPSDTILYQIGRLNHMSFSCVGCGMCTEICPAGIPVSAIFMRTGEETAKIFDYVPGRDVNEPVPVTVYKEEELSTLGEE